MLNILIPMAGLGSRFAKQGFSLPKPLIQIDSEAMIKLVIANVRPSRSHRFIFLCLKEHLREYSLEALLHAWAGPSAEVVPVEGVTAGAACTALLARDLIASAEPLMIVNSDQWVDLNIDHFLEDFDKRDLCGSIMTFYSQDPKWSYAAIDGLGYVKQVAEKKVISSEATVGMYLYRRGLDFVSAVEAMIRQEIRTNKEFYVAPAYNEMLAGMQRIGVYNIGAEGEKLHGLGTPEDYQGFKVGPGRAKAIAQVDKVLARGETLSLVIPLYNEAENIEPLVEQIRVAMTGSGLLELILVNNGSSDRTAAVINSLSELHPWIKSVHLKVNSNYGGGILAGLARAGGDFIGYLPGDGQVSGEDVAKVWAEVRLRVESKRNMLVKGRRSKRHDVNSSQLVSATYSFMTRIILGLNTRDINGLPKIFDRCLLRFLPQEILTGFIFDAQMLQIAEHQGFAITEIATTFHARRAGVSSWSGKRLKTYIETLQNLMKLRRGGRVMVASDDK